MPRARKRYGPTGKALPCTVKIAPALAMFIYREKLRQKYTDETELVAKIVRDWTTGLEAVDWPALLAELKAELQAQEQEEAKAEPERKKRPKK